MVFVGSLVCVCVFFLTSSFVVLRVVCCVCSLDDNKEVVESKQFPAFHPRFQTRHKSQTRAGAFSPDGTLISTGGVDCAVKVIAVSQIYYQMQLQENTSAHDQIRPVFHTFYDHTLPVNDIVFHPIETWLLTASEVHTQECTSAYRRMLMILDMICETSLLLSLLQCVC